MSVAILFGLLSALGYGTTDFMASLASRALGVVRAIFYSQALALILVSCWLLIHPGLGNLLAQASLGAWVAAAGSGVLLLLATAALFQGLTHGTLAVVAPVTASYGAVSALLGALSGERIPVLAGAGIVITLAGVVLTSAPNGADAAPRPARPASGLGWAFAAALGYGVGFWIQGIGAVPTLGAIVPVWMYYALGVTGLGLLGPLLGQSLAFPEARHRARVFGLGALSVVGNGAMTLGLATGHVAIVTVLSSLASAVTVVLARFLLQHPVTRHQWAGLASIMGGVALIHAAG